MRSLCFILLIVLSIGYVHGQSQCTTVFDCPHVNQTCVINDEDFSGECVFQDFARCFNAKDCNYNGFCDQETGLCECFDKYTTYDTTYLEGQCNYKRYSQSTALFLTGIWGWFGAGRLYVGDLAVGISKFFRTFWRMLYCSSVRNYWTAL